MGTGPIERLRQEMGTGPIERQEMGTGPIEGLGRTAAGPVIVGRGWEKGTDPVARVIEARKDRSV